MSAVVGKQNQAKRPLADGADRHALYQEAVQSPESDIEFFERVFNEIRDRPPLTLREDFCGTALLSTEWVKLGGGRRALGVDFDAPTLAWARAHNACRLPPGKRRHLRLVCADVASVAGPPTDLTCAMNFSFCALKSRDALATYLRSAYNALAKDGVFLCELYGGTEAVIEIEETREGADFTFVWEQETYNPISHETLCHIHFDFADGSRLRRAFTYDWRLWSIPEVRELLDEVGFRSSRVYWEQVDEEGDGTGEYLPTEAEENQEGWLVYIVAAK